MSVVFLFGAGASYGSEKGKNCTPPLGADLFKVLRKQAPNSWGKLDPSFAKLFESGDFETGMNAVIMHRSHDVANLQKDMATYLFQFFPSPENLYLKLVDKLSSVIYNIHFATLNYDRYLEQSILRAGFFPIVMGKFPLELKVGQVEVCLPHGCCHMFVDGIRAAATGVSFSFGNVSMEGNIISIGDAERFQHEIQTNGIPPVMVCFDSKKTASPGAKFIALQQQRFTKLVGAAKLVVVIGVEVREHDDHIWGSLKNTAATIAYCSGSGAVRFSTWHEKYRVGKPVQIFPRYFGDHLDEICNTVTSAISKRA